MNRQNEYRVRRAGTSKTLNLGVLNVQGCSTSEEKREEIGNMFRKRKLGVLALSETKMRGKGDIVIGGVGGRSSGVENGRAKEGVAILVSEEVKRCVTEWGEVSARLMWVRLKFGQEKWVIVSAYGPGRERDDIEREQFWNELRDCVNSFGIMDITWTKQSKIARIECQESPYLSHEVSVLITKVVIVHDQGATHGSPN